MFARPGWPGCSDPTLEPSANPGQAVGGSGGKRASLELRAKVANLASQCNKSANRPSRAEPIRSDPIRSDRAWLVQHSASQHLRGWVCYCSRRLLGSQTNGRPVSWATVARWKSSWFQLVAALDAQFRLVRQSDLIGHNSFGSPLDTIQSRTDSLANANSFSTIDLLVRMSERG